MTCEHEEAFEGRRKSYQVDNAREHCRLGLSVEETVPGKGSTGRKGRQQVVRADQSGHTVRKHCQRHILSDVAGGQVSIQRQGTACGWFTYD